MKKTGTQPKAAGLGPVGLGVVGLGAVLLAGCSGQAIDRFQQSDSTGSPFTQRLAAEYRQTVAFEAGEMYDWADAAYFARKGTQVALGEALPPETVEDWQVPKSTVAELSDGHGRLSKVLAAGARDLDPATAAVAQAKFDCWIEQQEENHQTDHITACRDDFLLALNAVEDKLAPPAAMDPTGNAPHLVFFDHDSAELTGGGQTTLQALIDAAKSGGVAEISVVGHADRSGDNAYNLTLSRLRAEAIRTALQTAGVTGSRITVEASGEASPAVVTPDGVREPSNRRAEIRLR